MFLTTILLEKVAYIQLTISSCLGSFSVPYGDWDMGARALCIAVAGFICQQRMLKKFLTVGSWVECKITTLFLVRLYSLTFSCGFVFVKHDCRASYITYFIVLNVFSKTQLEQHCWLFCHLCTHNYCTICFKHA